MTSSQILVTLGGLALSVFVAWFFWFAPKQRVHAAVGLGGVQEVAITVKGGYSPDVIVLRCGQPARLNFTRQESGMCSEQVVFPAFGKNAHLPEGKTVAVEFTPEEAGEFDFHCQMNMLRGKLIVEG
ncbi:MAG: cupredoxin domain-containing protein [Chloroflexi bacterium]|nr:cupredoxin domain-containing protein [Chloroflexota bacterium]